MFVFGIPLSFFLPLIVHALAGLTTVITGILAPFLSEVMGLEEEDL